MKSMKLRTLSILLLLTSTSLLGQQYSKEDFVELKRSNIDSVRNVIPDRVGIREFKITIKNNDIEINSFNREGEVMLEFVQGKLIGTDRGEWGGRIEFIDKASGERTLIKEGNVKFIFQYQGKICFIEGLAHLSMRTGSMYRLDYDNGVFTPVKIIDFEDAPEAMYIHNDILYIAGFETFFLVKDLKTEKVFSKTMWSGQYPNSLVCIDNRNVYVGFREGYAKLDIADQKIRYFVYMGR